MNSFVVPGLVAVTEGAITKLTVGVAVLTVHAKVVVPRLQALPDSVTWSPDMAK